MSDRQDEKRGPRRVPLCRCGTSSCSRTWSCRCSSAARNRSARSKRRWEARDKEIFLAAQKKAKTNDPTPEDIFTVGTLGTIIQLLRLPDGTVKVLVEGKRRARDPSASSQTDDFFLVEVERDARRARRRAVELEALMRSVQATFEIYVKLNKRIPPEMLITVQTIDDPARLADTIVAHLHAQAQRQAGAARDGVRRQAARAALRADAGRDRDPPGREEDPHPRQEADGEDAEGVLPQRADAGDPEGAAASATSSRTRSRSSKRRSRRRRCRKEAHAQGQEGAEEAQDDERR